MKFLHLSKLNGVDIVKNDLIKLSVGTIFVKNKSTYQTTISEGAIYMILDFPLC